MAVSIVELYRKTGTDIEQNALMPVTSNLDGLYRGEATVNFGLMSLLVAYHEAETQGRLYVINEDTTREEDKGWAKVIENYGFMDKDKEEDRESLTYALIMCREKGYIEVEIWDGYLYFKPTEKCMNDDLYRHRKNF